MPKIPKGDLKKSLTDLLESIALEEVALAHFVNAEAEKIQAITKSIEENKLCPEDIIKLQESIAKSMRMPIKQQMLLQFKLEDILNFKGHDFCHHEHHEHHDFKHHCKIDGICNLDKHKDLCHFPCEEFLKEVTLEIPPDKPDIKEVTKICLDPKVTSHKTIKTLEGFKTIIQGKIIKKIFYISDNCKESVRKVKFEIPFCTFVKLPIHIKGKKIEVFVEDISNQVISPRKISECILIFVCVIPGEECDCDTDC